MDKIIGMGNALVDVLVSLTDDKMLEELRLPKGSMQLINEDRYLYIKSVFDQLETKRSTGGSSGNMVKALAMLGEKPGFIGKIGPDEMGDFYRSEGEQVGIEMKLLMSEVRSGVASTFISRDGERTFATHLGAAYRMEASDLTPEMFKGYTYLYVEGYLVQNHDLIMRAMQLAKDAGLQVCLDLASYNIVAEDLDFFKLLVNRYVDIVFANEEEAKAFAESNIGQALDIISSLCSIAVIKLGSKGSVIKKGTEVVRLNTKKIDCVMDTTGAGDFYAAGFMFGLMNGYSLEKCGQIGTILATEVIQVIGTSLSDEKWNEIKLNIQQLVHVK
ncbi:MAG: adenosine kinase [Phocaeicola sp.]|nr:adenosine kinase [Phocaeicola sp.]